MWMSKECGEGRVVVGTKRGPRKEEEQVARGQERGVGWEMLAGEGLRS